MYLKPLSGHTTLSGHKQFYEYATLREVENEFGEKYLIRRDLAQDVCSGLDPDDPNKNWALQMDEDRSLNGNDVSYRGKRPRMYEQFIISVDPADNDRLEDFRRVLTEWCDTYFPQYDWGIIYHNDNGHLHGHVIINNTNLLTGRRLSPTLTRPFLYKIQVGLQDLAHENGFKNFKSEEEDHETGGETKPEDSPKQEAHKWRTRQEKHYTKTEIETLKVQGWSWKEDIRSVVDACLEIASSRSEFERLCEKSGVICDRASNGDYLFRHTSKADSRKVTGWKLGSSYAYRGVGARIAQNKKVTTPTPENKQSEEKVTFELKETVENRPQKISANKKYRVAITAYKGVKKGEFEFAEPKDILEMLELARIYNMKSIKDYLTEAEIADTQERREALTQAYNTAKLTGFRPFEYKPKGTGKINYKEVRIEKVRINQQNQERAARRKREQTRSPRTYKHRS